MRVTEIAKGSLKYSYLDSSDAFLLDEGGTGLYVWVGKGASKEEKLQGMKVAVNFLRSKKYPDFTQVKMVKQGMETALFKQCFVDWPRNTMNFQNKTYTAGRGIGMKFCCLQSLFSAYPKNSKIKINKQVENCSFGNLKTREIFAVIYFVLPYI